MKVIVDTSVLSLALRRHEPTDSAISTELDSLIQGHRMALLGIVRQELLSGAPTPKDFRRLRDDLRAFEDVHIYTEDHEMAAEFYNKCRSKGIQGSHIDFLICAVSSRLHFPIFTTDRDFARFSEVLPIRLHGYSRS